jgi:hypothetical protein
MSETIRDQRKDPPVRSPTTRQFPMRPGAKKLLRPSLADLADHLRDKGHVVYARCAHTPCHDTHQLVSTAAHFFEQALALSKGINSSHAYIRLEHSTQSLFLEVTQLAPESFNLVARDTAAHHTLDALNNWAIANNHLLSVRPGPRDQLRIAVTIASPNGRRQELPAGARGLSRRIHVAGEREGRLGAKDRGGARFGTGTRNVPGADGTRVHDAERQVANDDRLERRGGTASNARVGNFTCGFVVGPDGIEPSTEGL